MPHDAITLNVSPGLRPAGTETMHLLVLEDPKVDLFCESEEVGSSMSIATLRTPHQAQRRQPIGHLHRL